MHASTMLTILDKYLLSFMTTLRCLQETQSGPGVDKFLHFAIAFLNFSFEKVDHFKGDFKGISFKSCRFT